MFCLGVQEGSRLSSVGLRVNLKGVSVPRCSVGVIELICPPVPSFRKIAPVCAYFFYNVVVQ